MKSQLSREQAEQLDAADPLRKLRERFYVPEDKIYLDGNSLGLLCRDAEESLARVLNEWKTGGIGGWLNGDIPWFTMAETLAGRVAKLVGGGEGEGGGADTKKGQLYSFVPSPVKAPRNPP